MAHSFVRGNWRNQAESSPMILAKCCHDLDLMTWLVGARPRQINSFGNLRHFRPENAPEGAPQHCAGGCPVESQCIYSAIDIYVRLTPLIRAVQMAGNRPLKSLAGLYERYPERAERLARLIPPLRPLVDYDGWPVRVMTNDTTRQGRLRAVQDPANPYGRCVYHCDNDVVDHQHVAIDFENGVTATLIMHGHSYAEGRSMRIDGTKATLVGESYLHKRRLQLFDKRSGRRRLLIDEKPALGGSGHGGGDAGLMKAFAALVRSGRPAEVSTNAREALESHLLAFAAERSRLEGRVVKMEEVRR
jgi:predicted dehydrogenase